MADLFIQCKNLTYNFMTDTPKMNAKNNHVTDTGFFGNLHRLKNSPSTVYVQNMKTIAFYPTPKPNYPGLDSSSSTFYA